jgi:ribosomal protein S18 acetylase RimI-like enzyme
MSRALATWVEDPMRVVLVAEEGKRLIVGFAAGHVTDGDGLHAARRIGQVTDCFVAPPRRRGGCGRRLVSRLHDLLAEKGAECVRLQVAARNEASQVFWRTLGYDVLEEVLERPATARP